LLRKLYNDDNNLRDSVITDQRYVTLRWRGYWQIKRVFMSLS